MSNASDAMTERVRMALGPRPDIEEKKMFGGVGFMLDGNMMAGVSAKGALMVRVDPDQIETVLAQPGARQMLMGKRVMKGFITVDEEAITEATELVAWLNDAERFVRTLPAK
jgi:TfoX/Sxy family transcriptional regulator of competence genes